MEPQMAGDLHGPPDGHNFQAAWKGTYLESFMISDVGRKRHNNEDSCTIYAPEDEGLQQSRGVFFGVADGMGGASAGEYASCKALEYACKSYYDKNVHALVPAALRKAVESANNFIFSESEAKPEYSGMGTTFSALAIVGNWCYIAQVGDSRIYLLRKDKELQQITNDHSLVAEQVRNGLINKEDAHNHSLKNLITRAVGIREDIEVDLFALNLQMDDKIILCSDGLSNMVSDDLLMECLRGDNLEEAGHKMVQCALDAGGPDNITLIAIRISAPPPATNYQQGAKLCNVGNRSLFSRLFGFLRG